MNDLRRLPVLCRVKRISPEQAEAGLKFGRLHADYFRVMGLPCLTAASASLDAPKGGGSGQISERRISEVRRRYGEAVEALKSAGALWIVLSVCVEDRHPGWMAMGSLQAGLSALARVFVGKNRKRR